MPSAQDAPSPPEPPPPAHAPEQAGAAAGVQLALANRALWAATLSLMTAFMQTHAPAHRYLLARRIARNLETLARQECFDAPCRASFARLGRRWNTRSEQFAPESARTRSALPRLPF